LHVGLFEIVFVFLFVDLFDNVGTLVGVGKHAGLFDADNRIPRIGRILLTDATATVVGAVPTAATAPALIVVGSLMMAHLTEIAWGDPAIAIPAFLTLITIPLTFSIANGLAFGFTSYAVLRVVRGKFRETHWLVYVLAALFIVRFIYLGSN